MNKKALSERDICTKFITPAIERAQWDVMTQVREEVDLFDYIEVFYNQQRRHSSLEYVSPAEYEKNRRVALAA